MRLVASTLILLKTPYISGSKGEEGKCERVAETQLMWKPSRGRGREVREGHRYAVRRND